MTPRDWFRAHGVNVFPIAEGTKAPAVAEGASWAKARRCVSFSARFAWPMRW